MSLKKSELIVLLNMKNLLILCRPNQWIKNIFIFVPLFFHGDISNFCIVLNAFIAFICFCFVCSSIYCFNDIIDAASDRRHPKKCERPIAAGKVSVFAGYVLMLVLLLLSLMTSFFLPPSIRNYVLCLLFIYFVMNIAYCLKLKQIALVDVFIIAVGFVLRVLIGGLIGVELSHWIIIMTFLLALFLALAKRRDDVVIYKESGVIARKNVNRYNLTFMNQAITIISTITMVAYIMYTVSPEVMSRLHSNSIFLTSIFVLMGILRYLQLTIVDVKSGSPTKVLLHDHFLQLTIIGWGLSFLFLIYI